MTLRYLYSLERNKKSFRLVFPPEIFGAFIDIGNYETAWEKYEKTLEKIQSLTDQERNVILNNFRDMEEKSQQTVVDGQRIINGYRVLDIAGKGAFGQVFITQKGANRYALKEIEIAQVDDDAQSVAYSEDSERTMQEKGERNDKINKEVLILKNLDHPNII